MAEENKDEGEAEFQERVKKTSTEIAEKEEDRMEKSVESEPFRLDKKGSRYFVRQ